MGEWMIVQWIGERDGWKEGQTHRHRVGSWRKRKKDRKTVY